MPIIPSTIPSLLEAYDDLVTGSQDLAGAAAQIAPAAAREVLCQLGGLASLGAGPLAPFQSPGTGNRTLSDLGGILQAACPVPPPLPPVPEPPFEGGQCPGVAYSVSYEYVQITSFTPPETIVPPQSPFLANGPIGGLELFIPRTIQGEDGFGAIRVITGDGSTTLNQFASNTAALSARITGISRVDGLPDDCGSPPPVVPPRPPITQPPPSGPIPTVEPDGSPGPDIIFEPRVGPIFIGPGGEVNVPVTINIGGPTFNTPITIPVNVGLPDFNPTFNFGGSGGVTGPGGDGGEPSPPVGICCPPPPNIRFPTEPQNPDDPPEPPPIEDARIIGVVVISGPTGAPVGNSTYENATPTLLVPRIATVQFELDFGGELFVGPDTSVKLLNQFVQAPSEGVVTRVFVDWEPGYEGAFEVVLEPQNPEP